MSQPYDIIATPAPLLPLAQASRSNEANIDALLHQYIVQVQEGRLHPALIPVSRMARVLDLGCGAGEWMFDLAKCYPRLHIYGIDVNEELVHQAKIRRNLSGMGQIEMRQMNLTQPLPISSEYIDFVSMRRCTRFIPPYLWPHIIRDCVRILRPDGWLAASELEFCEISSPACITLHRAMLQARTKLKRTMDTSGTSLGIAQRLYSMLLAASLEDVAYDLHTIDLGFMGGNMARVFVAEIVRQVSLARPLIVQMEIFDNKEFDMLIAQAKCELQEPDLCGWSILVTAYGRKEEKEEEELGAF